MSTYVYGYYNITFPLNQAVTSFRKLFLKNSLEKLFYLSFFIISAYYNRVKQFDRYIKSYYNYHNINLYVIKKPLDNI